MAKPATNAVGKKQKGLLALATSISLKLLTGISIGFLFHEPIERVVDFVQYHNTPASKHSYQDTRGFDGKVYTNEYGERQTYIVTTGEEPQKIPIDKDLLPVNSELEKRLLERYQNMSPEEAKKVLPFLEKQKEIIYQKIESK